MVQFLDPDTDRKLPFLDPEIVKLVQQYFWTQKLTKRWNFWPQKLNLYGLRQCAKLQDLGGALIVVIVTGNKKSPILLRRLRTRYSWQFPPTLFVSIVKQHEMKYHWFLEINTKAIYLGPILWIYFEDQFTVWAIAHIFHFRWVPPPLPPMYVNMVKLGNLFQKGGGIHRLVIVPKPLTFIIRNYQNFSKCSKTWK